ncbi:MAG: hypothetical protein WCI92_18140 [Bacteroidota bacterium]
MSQTVQNHTAPLPAPCCLTGGGVVGRWYGGWPGFKMKSALRRKAQGYE